MLKKGDKVVMNDKYYVDLKYQGKVFTVKAGPQMVCGSECVWLEGYCGAYSADGLDLVESGERN